MLSEFRNEDEVVLFDKRKANRLLEELASRKKQPDCLSEAQAINFAAGACTAEEKSGIDKHLLECEICSKVVRRLYDQQDEHPLTMKIGSDGKPKKLRQ